MNFSTFPLGPFVISTGGIITFLGIIAGAIVLIRTVRDEEVSLKFLSDHLFFFVVIPLLLGRFGAFLSLWPSIQYKLPEENSWYAVIEVVKSFFLINDSGSLRADWAMGGFFLVFFVIAFWKKEKSFAWLDAFILPGIMISAFVSIGGYFSAWGYGRPAPDWLPFPFTVNYDLQEVRFSEPVYAVQLYSAIIFALAFWAGWILWQRKVWRKWPPGKFFAVMVVFLGIANGLLEFYRGDSVAMPFGIRLPMILGFAISLLAIVFLLLRNEGSFLERKGIKRG